MRADSKEESEGQYTQEVFGDGLMRTLCLREQRTLSECVCNP